MLGVTICTGRLSWSRTSGLSPQGDRSGSLRACDVDVALLVVVGGERLPALGTWSSSEWTLPCHGRDRGFKSRRSRLVVLGLAIGMAHRFARGVVRVQLPSGPLLATGPSVQWEDARLADARSGFDSPRIHAFWGGHRDGAPPCKRSCAGSTPVLSTFLPSRCPRLGTLAWYVRGLGSTPSDGSTAPADQGSSKWSGREILDLAMRVRVLPPERNMRGSPSG